MAPDFVALTLPKDSKAASLLRMAIASAMAASSFAEYVQEREVKDATSAVKGRLESGSTPSAYGASASLSDPELIQTAKEAAEQAGVTDVTAS